MSTRALASGQSRGLPDPDISKAGRVWRQLLCVLLLGPCLGGCIASILPSLRQPDRLYPIEDELAPIRQALRSAEGLTAQYYAMPNAGLRNEIISLRMYAIDLYYTKYESQLTHESQDANFIATAVSLGLTTAGSLITVAETTRILSGLATGVTGLNTAYNEKVLLNNAIQNVQSQMRANRHEQAALIYASMQCRVDVYPMGMALSDLEGYYRGGTFTAGLVRLSGTVNKAEQEAKARKEVNSPAALPEAGEKLRAEGEVKMAESDPRGCAGRPSAFTTSQTLVSTRPLTRATSQAAVRTNRDTTVAGTTGGNTTVTRIGRGDGSTTTTTTTTAPVQDQTVARGSPEERCTAPVDQSCRTLVTFLYTADNLLDVERRDALNKLLQKPQLTEAVKRIQPTGRIGVVVVATKPEFVQIRDMLVLEARAAGLIP